MKTKTRKESIRSMLIEHAAEKAELENSSSTDDCGSRAARRMALRFEDRDLERELSAIEDAEVEAGNRRRRASSSAKDERDIDREIAAFERGIERVLSLFERLADDDKAIDRLTKVAVKVTKKAVAATTEIAAAAKPLHRGDPVEVPAPMREEAAV